MATQITNIEVRHASDAVARRVEAWFRSNRKAGLVDGSRSVHLPHPEMKGMSLKIKGAGYNGAEVRFGTYCRKGPAALTFDFDGRAVEDVASGHNNAFLGGASFQQAATEYIVTKLIEEQRIPVVPCLGYGRIVTGQHAAWFSLFEWDRNWAGGPGGPAGAICDYLDMNHRVTRAMLHLAVEHDLVGYCSIVTSNSGNSRLKDLHPFRRTDSITMSQLSWVMQLLFALNVRCQAIMYFPAAAKRRDVPADIVVHVLRPVLADATQEDYEAIRTRIIKPYMRLPLENFDPGALATALRETRIGSALMELCPTKYARW